MRITRVWLPFFCVTTLLISCQKELSFENDGNGGNPGTGGPVTTDNIIGEWHFVGMNAQTSADVEVTSGADQTKTETTSGYISESNMGTVKITASEFISTNVGYSINSTMNVKTYINNMLFDEQDLPFVFTAPPSSGTSTYTRISSDSIVVTGYFGAPSMPAGTMPVGPVGVKLSVSGDTLFLKVDTSFAQSVTQGGIPATMNASVVGTSKLKKK